MSGTHQPESESKKTQQTMEPNNEHEIKTEGAKANVTSTNQHDISATAIVATSTQPVILSATNKCDFIFGKCIGEGSFSEVYLGTEKNTGREYAIKVCNKRHIRREHKQGNVRREREVLQIMTNVAGFLKLVCTFQDSRSCYFVMTYAHNGELLPHIKRVGCFSVECARHYAAELVLACEQMHRRNVVHRDLKPENILLDKHMHTLIADFGSAKVLTTEDIAAAASFYSNTESSDEKLSPECSLGCLESRESIVDDVDLCIDPGFDHLDKLSRPQNFRHNRKGSFVGTAQYVSPEVLQDAPISPAADLWALGCILYQMVSGLPPFRGSCDFDIFKEIIACQIEFPEHFDKCAEELVRQLLKPNPQERLGAQDDYVESGYISIRQHAFFAGIDFETIREQKPPKIFPYLPCFSKENCEIQTTNTLESELEKLLSLSTSDKEEQRFDLTIDEKQKFLEQQKTDKWHFFADSEVMLKKGFVHKHKGLFASKRMLILTTGPHLIYVDPVEMIKSGEIPWGPELRGEMANSKVFFVHTSERTYFFYALESSAPEWILAIEKVHRLTYKENNQAETTMKHTTQILLSTEE